MQSNSEGYKSLIVYQKAYKVAMEIFKESKKIPKEEVYALTDQIRRSSRSVCANIAEAYRKRLYPKQFVSTLSISDAECAETTVHLDFAKDCEYLSPKAHQTITDEIYTNRQNAWQHDELTGKIFGEQAAGCTCLLIN